MVRLLVLILILIIGVAFGLSLEGEQGLLLIVHQGKSYEMALWFGGLILVFSFVLFYYTLRFLSGFFSLKQWISEAAAHQRVRKAQTKTSQGLVALANGQWAKEKNLLAGVQWSKMPFVNYLFLARAAQAQNAIDRRDHYLELAKKLGNTDLAQKMLMQEFALLAPVNIIT
jgi:HemY protein